MATVKATATQIVGLLGIFFLLGFILSKLQEWTQENYRRRLGWRGILWTAWIGTPIHELGHYLLAKLFRHRITQVAIFQPNAKTGELGHVDHSFDPASLYQKIGNFFIGAAPMIFGSLVLWLLVRYLLPGGEDVFTPLLDATDSFSSFRHGLTESLISLFRREHIGSWSFWLFIYVSFAVASHLAPSKIDRAGMWRGLGWIIVLLMIMNLFAVLLKLDLTKYILGTTNYLGIFTAIFLYATLVSALHWLFSLVILSPWRR